MRPQVRRAHRTAPGRDGMALWLVLAASLVVAVLAFSFHLVARQQNAQAHAVYFGEVAASLAESGMTLGWRDLRQATRPQEGRYWDLFVTTPLEDLTGVELPLELGAAGEALTEDRPGAHLEVTARVISARPLGGAADLTRGHDPYEREVLVELVGRGEFRGVPREVRARRRVQVQLDNLSTLSRFTLFVRQAEGGAGPGYNRYANDINGSPDLRTVTRLDNYLPLVLFNHGDTFARIHHDLAANGAVYLGGDDPVTLNLTSGADWQFGEYFHFFDLLGGEETSTQPAFLAASPPPFFLQDHQEGDQLRRYYLKHVIYGWFTVDRGTPPGNMNRRGVLDRYFGRRQTMRSSSLHLFGSPVAPSPTMVFGEVRRSYPIYSGVTVDVDDDGRRDGLVSLLPALEDGEYGRLDALAPLPDSIRDLSRPGATLSLDPSVLRWDTMFPDEGAYRDHMSTLIEAEAYNYSVDTMRGDGTFPVEETSLDADLDYPNPGRDVTLRRRGDEPRDQRVLFQGDLAGLDDAALRARVHTRVKDAAEFRRRFLRRPGCLGHTQLHLGAWVLIEEGDLHLPPEVQVEAGGAILLQKGDLRFDGLTCAEGERLSLIALEGNLRSPFQFSTESAPLEADLVALQGRVRVTNRGQPLRMRGTLAVQRYAPEDSPQGGRILYPTEADPASTSRAAVARVRIPDRAESWQM